MRPPAVSEGFDLQPVLRGELVILRPLRPGDWDELYSCAADPLVWEVHPQRNRYEREVFRKFFDGALESGGAFAVLDGEVIIGSSRYYGLRPGRVIVGYTFLCRDRWGGKYNYDMKKLMLDHAFRFVDAVDFEIGLHNHRSRRAIEKLGALLIRTEDLDEKPHVVYEIQKENWQSRSSV